jgi:EAL and modified HD-GYP domain-containing signal transduction protein
MLKSLFSSLGRKPAEQPADTQPATEPAADAVRPAQAATHASLRRQLIIDRAERVIAYELSTDRHQAFRTHQWQPVTRRLFDDMLLSQLAQTDLAPLLRQRRVFLPVGSGIVHHPLLKSAARANVVLHLSWHDVESQRGDETLASRMAKLHAMGITLACAHDLADDADSLDAADFITIDGSRVDPAQLLDVVRRSARRGRERPQVAMNVDSMESFQACRDMGFGCFHGEFLTLDRQGEARVELPPYRLAALELMDAIRRQASYEELAEKAWSDPTVVLRLLRYVNSPAIGLRAAIRDLKHAISYIGYEELYRWVTLLLFSIHRAGDRDPMESVLRESALARARLMEQLGAKRLPARECGQLFVAGILSSIHLLLHMPMEEALARFTLPPDLTQALVHREGPYAPYLELAFACERADQRSIEQLAEACGLDTQAVNRLHIESLQWMLEFTETMEDPG